MKAIFEIIEFVIEDILTTSGGLTYGGEGDASGSGNTSGWGTKSNINN